MRGLGTGQGSVGAHRIPEFERLEMGNRASWDQVVRIRRKLDHLDRSGKLTAAQARAAEAVLDGIALDDGA